MDSTPLESNENAQTIVDQNETIQEKLTTFTNFNVGDKAILIDTKKRRYLLTLEVDGQFHSHNGWVEHNDIIGMCDGSCVKSTKGTRYEAYKPTLSDTVFKMPRGAQVIYPKDIGAILLLADIYPGAKIFESGIGSGALSMAMLRAGAEIYGYELRSDFANRAKKNVQDFLGPEVMDRYHIEERDTYEGIDVKDMDRVVLDLPEPWEVVEHAQKALRPGGIFVAYTPSITQACKVQESLRSNSFRLIETIEILHRGWHIDGQAVRPDHRMVGHTGFLTSARLFQE